MTIKTHPEHTGIAMPKDLIDLDIVVHNGVMRLSDTFRLYKGAIFQSPELEQIAARYDYDRHGYKEMSARDGHGESIILSDVTGGKLGPVKQGILNSEDKLEIQDLAPYLQPFEKKLRPLMRDFAAAVRPLMGRDFEVRLQKLEFKSLLFHMDPDVVIAIQPLGGDPKRKSTLCEGVSEDVIITPPDGALVTTTPLLPHTSPISDIPRAALMATKYQHNMR